MIEREANSQLKNVKFTQKVDSRKKEMQVKAGATFGNK